MRLQIIAVGTKMPSWVTNAFAEYAKRFPKDYPLSLVEIPIKNAKTLTLPSIPKGTLIALDERGKSLTTLQFSEKLQYYQNHVPQLSFLIGGPDGIPKEILALAEWQWSLSPLTFPHPMVRLLLIEQLYRAVTVLQNHPYHRN